VTGYRVIQIAIFTLWLAMLALAYMVVRAIGWSKVRHYWMALFFLSIALMGLPGAGVLKLAWPYRYAVIVRIIRAKSPPIVLNGGCTILPENNVWNTPIFNLPVLSSSRKLVETMGPDLALHPDFGLGGGVPYNVTQGLKGTTQITFGDGAPESDPGPYAIPDDAVVERAADLHLLVIDGTTCKLYELFGAEKIGSQRWEASSGAIYDLRSNALRPEGWTSADGAGLPILPGLVRYEEVKAGHIRHCLRFTTPRTTRAISWPARHFASRFDDPALPAMGTRFRLRSSFDISRYSPDTQVILMALKEYGMMVSDNGGPWFLTGAPDSRWSSTLLRELRTVTGSDFEAVDLSSLLINRNTGEARQ